MEVWLSWNNNEERLRLPVLPPEFEVTVGNMNTRININELGEINLIGKSGLREMTIERFFPAQDYYFVEYSGFPDPYECTAMIEKWRKSGRPIRLIITETPINIAMAIENFSYGQRDGTGDVYYTLELAEYVFSKIRQKPKGDYKPPSVSTASKAEEPSREVKAIAEEYTVKPGDTLWAIAKRSTGNGANYKEIARKNNINNPDLIHPGQVLKL